MTRLDPKQAFMHVVDDHRWLAAAGCSWNLAGPNITTEEKAKAHGLLPNIDVAILDSMLLHTRSLIDFYTKTRTPWPTKPRSKRKLLSTDILLVDFDGLSIDSPRKAELIKYKRPIEVHLLHLTIWRDTDIRKGEKEVFRPDWNVEVPKIVELIFESLKYVSEQNGRWQRPFKNLHDASIERYRDLASSWPEYFWDKAAMEKYFASLQM